MDIKENLENSHKKEDIADYIADKITQEVYDAFNSFIFSNEIKVIGKLLTRFDFFKKTMHLPGDIVELGVFKGSGMASWLKIMKILTPNSNKKVIGFDFFNHNETTKNIVESYLTGNHLQAIIDRSPKNQLTLDNVTAKLTNISDPSKFILVPGDVKKTTLSFVLKNPGFRISILYLDLDTSEPTYFSLLHLWDRILPGGFIIFDEYEYHKFDESSGVERFLNEKQINFEIQSTQFISPSAFMIKLK